MSIGPMGGIIGSAAGAPLAQTKGADADRAGIDATAQARAEAANRSAENAAGIGETSEDQQADERDADGRRIWEIDEQKKRDEQAKQQRQSKDATGQAGNQLDLSG